MTAKKRNNRPNTSLAKRQQAIAKALLNKKKNPTKDLTFWQKIGRYKKWFHFGIFSLFFTFYIKYWPDKIEVSDRLLGEHNKFSNPSIILKNPNSYMIENINVKVDISVSLIGNNGTAVLDNIGVHVNKKIFEIPAKKPSHIVPDFTQGIRIDIINKCALTVISSFETPFMYPNIENDTVSYTGILKSNGDVEYLPN